MAPNLQMRRKGSKEESKWPAHSPSAPVTRPSGAAATCSSALPHLHACLWAGGMGHSAAGEAGGRGQMFFRIPSMFPLHRGTRPGCPVPGAPQSSGGPGPHCFSGALHLCHDDSFHSFFPHACSLLPEYEPMGAACLADCLGLSWISTWQRGWAHGRFKAIRHLRRGSS